MPELRKDLGLFAMTALAVSMMLGSGIFFGPTLTAREFPDARIVMALWLVGAVIALTGAWVFGRLAAQLPLSGGPYAYVKAAYGPMSAFLYSWTSLVIIAPTSAAVIALLLATNLASVVALPVLPTAVGALLLFAAVNLLGVKQGGRVQTALSALKVALVLGLLVVLLALPASSSPGAGASASAGAGRWSIAFVGILFAYGGWDYAVLASEEVSNASTTIPRGLMLGTAIVSALYLLVVVGYLLALGAPGIAASAALGPDAVARVLPAGAAVFALAIAISAAGTINAIALLGPRATFAPARDGLVPSVLARVSRTGAPSAAIVLQVVLATAYLLALPLETIAGYTVLGTGYFIVASALGSLWLRKERRVLETIAALVVAGAYAWFIVFLVVEDPRTAAFGMGLILAGVVPYLVLRALRKRRNTEGAEEARGDG